MILKYLWSAVAGAAVVASFIVLLLALSYIFWERFVSVMEGLSRADVALFNRELKKGSSYYKWMDRAEPTGMSAVAFVAGAAVLLIVALLSFLPMIRMWPRCSGRLIAARIALKAAVAEEPAAVTTGC
ncbi:unnamed protein product [Strongylus vulgaris]|uniref:Uncharacterized protein n=1 Tax=Strongylus vulgaris TaxID=40348 RepID=A0A3P7LS87_STRVU|nr:unnamed protein product [Strongylus vulgaris]